VQGLSRRLVELRTRAAMTQQEVADAMGKSSTGKRVVGRLERGGLESASLLTMAEYLRAIRAGFGDLKDVLDRYTSLAIPEPARKRAEAAPLPRVQAGESGDSPSERADARYSPRFPGRQEPCPYTPSRDEELRVLRIRRRAGYWALRKVFEHFLHTELTAIGVSPASWFRRATAQYARRVFNALFRTRGKKESKRQEWLARLRERAKKKGLVDAITEYMEAAVTLVFDDMGEHDELDWMPPEAEARAVMSVKPKHRVVTDAQMCLAEWAEVSSRYNFALMAIYERPHEAALDVAESARCDGRTLGCYRWAALRAANIARSTAPDTRPRKKSIDDWRATDWPPEMDRKLLGRILAAALAEWDPLLPTLPPVPGPRPL